MAPRSDLTFSETAELRHIVGDTNVIATPENFGDYVVDETRRFPASPSLIVLPGDTRQVSQILQFCNQRNIGVVPQSGNTGLVGGTAARPGQILLNLGRLKTLSDVDVVAGQVTAGAGVTLLDLQTHAEAADWAFGLDFGARGSAMVGGMVGTNPGGTNFARYGGMREQVIGFEAVLADGRVISHLDGNLKDNTGYHLPSLLVGSEGTLAVVTQARLRLVPRTPHRAVAVVALASTQIALDVLMKARQLVPSLNAGEFFFPEGVKLVETEMDHRARLSDAPAYLLLELAERLDPSDRLLEVLGAIEDDILDAQVSQSTADVENMWKVREHHTEAIRHLSLKFAGSEFVLKLDVTVPVPRVPMFADYIREQMPQHFPGTHTFVFGHLGDGNLHIGIVGDIADREHAIESYVLSDVARFDGSISAEHGIGRAKRDYLNFTRSDAEIAVFRMLKDAFDPNGILNPGALLPEVETPRVTTPAPPTSLRLTESIMDVHRDVGLNLTPFDFA